MSELVPGDDVPQDEGELLTYLVDPVERGRRGVELGKFEPAHKAQMELYLRWLDAYERQDGEDSPIGLILCAQADRDQVEFLEMYKNGIAVAEYWTVLPPKAELEAKLGEIVRDAQERLARRGITRELHEADDD